MSRALALAFALLGSLLAPPAHAAQPIEPLGSITRLTTTGGEGDATVDAERANLAYDGTRDRYLLVYDSTGSTATERDVYGLILSGDGTPVGGQFKIAGAQNDATGGNLDEAPSPAVAYSAPLDDYVVVYSGETATAGEHEIFSITLDGGTLAIAGGPFQVSNAGAPGEPLDDAIRPAIAADTEVGGFLVAWEADGTVADQLFQIFAKRLDATGNDVGSAFNASSSQESAAAAHVAYVPTNDSYVLTWHGDPQPQAAGDREVFASLVDKGTGALGPRAQVSNVSPDSAQQALASDVTYNPETDEIAVAFIAEQSPLDGFQDGEIVFQRLTPALAEVAPEAVISTTAGNPSPTANADMPRVAYHPGLDSYLVTWRSDGAVSGQADGEHELFGQVLSQQGAEVGVDQRITSVGVPADSGSDAVESSGSNESAVRYGVAANTTRREWLVAFAADKTNGVSDNEFEIFGQRFGENPDDDGDGSSVPADCNDADATIKPGATDVVDNGIDEDCSGADAQLPPPPPPPPAPPPPPPVKLTVVDVGISTQFVNAGRRTRLKVLSANRVRAGDKVEVRCSGGKKKGCRSKLRRFTVRKAGTLNLLSAVKGARMRAGVRLEVRVARPGFIGKVVRFQMRKLGIPRSQVLCLPVGTSTPKASCT